MWTRGWKRHIKYYASWNAISVGYTHKSVVECDELSTVRFDEKRKGKLDILWDLTIVLFWCFGFLTKVGLVNEMK